MRSSFSVKAGALASLRGRSSVSLSMFKGANVASKMLTAPQAAEFTGIKVRTWYAWYQVWNVPHYRLGRRIMFSESDLTRWMESRHVT